MEDLEDEAQYGALPFDYYVIEHWPEGIKESPQKWEQLAWKYQELSLIARFVWLPTRLLSCDFILIFNQSYHDRAHMVLAQINSSGFTEEQIEILNTHQSIHERNICASQAGSMQTVWLRTCYDKDLSEKYEDMKAEGTIEADIGSNRYLDDSSRYAFDDGTPDHWRQVLTRVPGITDLMGIDEERGFLEYRSCQNIDEVRAQCEELENEEDRSLALKELEFQVVVYLLDREAIETGLIKMLWLDEHSCCIWDNRIHPDTVEWLAVAFLGATRLSEMNSSGRGSLITQ
ncbi:hypothetical protein N7457_007934 [Penicillium paradoxum]|uniref:uncharacterized protein n=1 Tax=Penicillium paradoxum TaxID=176176 RepID=UPI002548DF74|nr:uncharacterized protein N7457_007934 [Penicillium paradoxum]KAJ5773038.1 hypothetical protein N7457_007934 [Penicillium paradoxum]